MNSNYCKNICSVCYQTKVPTLYDRAVTPRCFSTLKNITFKKNKKFCTFLLEFASETIKMTISSNDAWIIEFNTPSDTNKELVYNEKINELEISDGSSKLIVNTKSFSIKIVKDSKTLLCSVDDDLNVGNITILPPIFIQNDSLSLSFNMHHQENFYGGGETFGEFRKNGTMLIPYNFDTLGVNSKLQYQSTPFYYSDRGYSIFFSSLKHIDFGAQRNDIYTCTINKNSSLKITLGNDPCLLIKKHRERLSLTKKVPDWSYKLWLSRCYYKNKTEILDLINSAKEHDIKFKVINLDAKAWMDADTRTDFKWCEDRFGPFKSFMNLMKKEGIELSLWESPYVSSKAGDIFMEGVEKGYFVKRLNGDTYLFDWVPEGLKGFQKPPPAAIVDFTNKDAWTWWQNFHLPYLKEGVKIFKTDFGEEIPHDACFSNGKTGLELRNTYSDLYNSCVTEVVSKVHKDGLIWTRSGHLKTHSNPVKWAGDSQTSFRALRSTLRAGLSQAFGGAIFWSNDIGGFYGERPSDELYLRWSQMCMYISHIRTHGTTPREPWEFPTILDIFKEALHVREILEPYFITTGNNCVKDNCSFILPLKFLYPDDRVASFIDDQFFSGKDLIVAPYLDSKASRKVYLPKGKWVDLRSGKVLNGETYFSVNTDRHIPVYSRQNSKHKDIFKRVINYFKE